MDKFTLLTVVVSAALASSLTANADPAYAELLPANATVEDCARKIVDNMISTGNFKDIRAKDFRCRAEILNLGATNCKFTAQDGATTPNAYRGNVKIKLYDRRVENPRTGARSYFKYCRIAPSCLFTASWPFGLFNTNGTLIQRDSACVLDTDRLTDL